MSRLRFPYQFTKEEHVPRYARYRAEGRSPLSRVLHTLAYLKKYRLKKTTAPTEEGPYFDQHRRLLQFMSNKGTTRNTFAQDYDTRLALVGDLMWLGDGWQSFLSPEVLNYLNGFHVVLGNLETVISANFKARTFHPDYRRYNSDPALVQSFVRPDGTNTFTALSLANNHALDFGDRGLLDTLDFLDGLGVRYAGVARSPKDKPYTTFTVNGIKFGFCAFTWGLNNPRKAARSSLRISVLPGIAPEVEKTVDISDIRHTLQDMANDGAEFKIVGMHWGYGFETYPDPKLMLIGRELIRHGADVILGSHPHVCQPVEVCFVNGYERRFRGLEQFFPAMNATSGCILKDTADAARKALIAYSLGNFTTAMETPECQKGLILSLKVGRDPKTGRVDWDLPDTQSVLNVPKDATTGGRRLVLHRAAEPTA
jgi:poly-gamma-glutamate synthesis protein (capsule biosynthesis protein)